MGMLFAPTSGERARHLALVEARRRRSRLGTRLKVTQQSIRKAGDEAAGSIKKAASEAVDRYVPDLLGDDEAWQDVYTRTVKDVEDEKC